MITPDLQKQIALAIEALEPEKIILFGSQAYGATHQDSDIDLLVIKNIPPEKVKEFRLLVRKKLWEKFKGQGKGFDVLVDSPDRIEERISLGDLFYDEIIKKGKVIYA